MRNIYYYLIDNQTFPFRAKGKTVDYQYNRVFQSGLNYKILFFTLKGISAKIQNSQTTKHLILGSHFFIHTRINTHKKD